MEKQSRDLKIKFLLLMILSNSSIYLLASTPSEDGDQIKQEYLEYRKDYVLIKIKAKLLGDFRLNSPITITNKTRSFVIPYSIFVEYKSLSLIHI